MKSAVTISSPTTSDKTQQQPFHQQAQDRLLLRRNTTIQELSSNQFIIYYHNSTLYLITYQHHKTKQLPFHYSVLLHTIVSLFSNFSLWSLQDQAAQNEKIMTPHFQSVSVTVPVYSTLASHKHKWVLPFSFYPGQTALQDITNTMFPSLLRALRIT